MDDQDSFDNLVTHVEEQNINYNSPDTNTMSDNDKTLRMIAFIFMVISLIGSCWLIIPLAWMIPMTVIGWGIYKGTRPNTTAFAVCTLLFFSLVAGILLLVSTKDR